MKKITILILLIIIAILVASCQHNSVNHKKKASQNISKNIVVKSKSNENIHLENKNVNLQTISENNSNKTNIMNSNSEKSQQIGSNPNISKYQIFNQNWYTIYENFVNKDNRYSNMNIAFSLSKNDLDSTDGSSYTGTFYQFGKSGMQYIKIYISSGSATIKLLNPPRNNSSGASNISPYIRAILKYSMQNSPIPERLYSN